MVPPRCAGATVGLMERASAVGRPGPYRIEAVIAALHCEAPSWDAADWHQLLHLYTLLTAVDPRPSCV